MPHQPKTAADSGRGVQITMYQDLCADPHGKVEEIFSFVGWPVPGSLHTFIDASTQGEKKHLSRSKSYYSVYRDPRASLWKWKSELTEAQQREIAVVFSKSPLCNLWPDLSLPHV